MGVAKADFNKNKNIYIFMYNNNVFDLEYRVTHIV
jgi:hypothetical protein